MDVAHMHYYLDAHIEELENQAWGMSEADEHKHLQLLALSIQLAQAEMLERIAEHLECISSALGDETQMKRIADTVERMR